MLEKLVKEKIKIGTLVKFKAYITIGNNLIYSDDLVGMIVDIETNIFGYYYDILFENEIFYSLAEDFIEDIINQVD